MSAIGGLRGAEHIGITVPDLEAAKTFFVEALGCEVWYELGKVGDPEGTWMSDNLDVHPRAEPTLAMLRCANGPSFELLEYTAPDQVQRMPKASDWGAVHIAFYVDDMDAALAHVEAHGARVLGDGRKDCMSHEAGEEAYFSHFLTPWGQMLEFVSYPNGREYMKDGKPPLWKPEPVS